MEVQARAWSRLARPPRCRSMGALGVHKDRVALFKPRRKGTRGFARTAGRDSNYSLIHADAVTADRTDDEARGLHCPESLRRLPVCPHP